MLTEAEQASAWRRAFEEVCRAGQEMAEKFKQTTLETAVFQEALADKMITLARQAQRRGEEEGAQALADLALEPERVAQTLRQALAAMEQLRVPDLPSGDLSPFRN